MSTVSKVSENLIPTTRDPFQLITFPEKLSFWGIAILLFFAPFFRGLFFPEEQRLALLLAAVAFWLISLAGYLDKDRRFFSSPLEYLLLGLPLAYLISTISAANYGLSIDELLENLLYFAVFWSVVRFVRCTEDIEKLFGVILTSAVLVSLAGLFTASGWLDIKDGFLTSDGGTIASTFQYKNSLASFLIAAIFIGLYLNNKVANNITRYIINAAKFIMLLVLFSTKSHGGYIIFAMFGVALCFLNPVQTRFRTITNTVTLGILALVGSKLFLQNIAAKAIGQAWLWVILGVVISLLLAFLGEKLSTSGREPKITFKKLLIATTVIMVMLCAAMADMGIFQMLYQKLHMLGAMERITMYQDGLKMIKEKPFFGWGGGGWSEAYTMFQSYGYNVRQTHSYFIQLAIETGLVGLAFAISFWLVFLAKAYKVYKSSIQDKDLCALAATLICSVLAIISHAVFDFDLSLAALTITMYALIACLVSIDNTQQAKLKSKQGSSNVSGWGLKISLSTLATLLVLTGALLVASSGNLYNAALKAIQVRDGQSAIKNIEQAIAMNPLRSENYALASQLQIAMGNAEGAKEHAEKAVKMAQYNPAQYSALATIYLRNDENEKAVTAVQKAMKLAPLKVAFYEAYANVLTSAAINELRAENTQVAEKYINQTLQIPNDIEKVLASVNPDKKKLWTDIGAQPLVVSDKIKLQLGIAHLLQGNTNEANKYLTEIAQNPAIQKDTIIWQALLAQKQGDNKKADELLNSAQKETPNIKKQFEELAKIKLLTTNQLTN